MKRIFLFLLVNFLVVMSVSVILSVFNLGPQLTAAGINYGALVGFCLVWGFSGAFISLLLSKWMAKKAFGVQIIDHNTINPAERKLLLMAYNCSKKAGIEKMPEVGYYESPEINAFATGATKNSSLVAVSTGLIANMTEEQVEGVIGHEVGHIANGDMVTMTLLQGVVNSFVMFLSRAIAFGISNGTDRKEIKWALFYAVQIVLEIILMILGSLVVSYFSRQREYRADAYSAKLVGREKMISALKVLQAKFEPIDKHPGYKTMQISGSEGFLGLFSTHPKIANRIKKLEKNVR